MNYEHLLKNGTVLLPDGSREKKDVLIKNGLIAAVETRIPAKSIPVTDVSGLLLLPGMTDPHVHFREPGMTEKEGILNGSKAALKGGVTTVFDMPNTIPPCDSPGVFVEKRKLFSEKALVNWGLFYMATPDMNRIPETAVGVKVFMARSSSRTACFEEDVLMQLFKLSKRIAVHAEDESAFTNAPVHHLKRNRQAIIRAHDKIRRVLTALDRKDRPRVVLCHASTIEDIQWLKDMKSDGFDVWGETAPHYLYFTSDDEQKYGSTYCVNPPLRDAADREALREGVREGIIDFIGTDHAPHLPEEKALPNPPSGIPGIEWAVPAVLKLADQNVIPWSRVTNLLVRGAAECYGVKNMLGLRPGSQADIIAVSRKKDDHIVTKASYNPYERENLPYSVCLAMVNGNTVYHDSGFDKTIKGKEILSADCT